MVNIYFKNFYLQVKIAISCKIPLFTFLKTPMDVIFNIKTVLFVKIKKNTCKLINIVKLRL